MPQEDDASGEKEVPLNVMFVREFTVNRNENVTSTGKRIWVTWTNRAICDGSGFPVGVVSVGTED